MTDLNDKQVISGLGDGQSDAYGLGYDVVTSAQVDTFGSGSDLRVYYEGKHSDFVDLDDVVNGTEGIFDMSAGKSDRGSNWETEVDDLYAGGQEPGFYIEVSGKKLAVTFDEEKGANGEWKVDTTSLQVAEDASGNITTVFNHGDTAADFAEDVMARYGLKPADTAAHQFSNDIYLNATEEAITELLATGVASDKSFNFGFYTKMDLNTDQGTVSVNLKLSETITSNVETWLASNPAPVIADAKAEVTQAQYQAYQDLVTARDNAQTALNAVDDPGDTPQASTTTSSVWSVVPNPVEISNGTHYTNASAISVDVDGNPHDLYQAFLIGDSTTTGWNGVRGHSEGGLSAQGNGSNAAIYAIKDPNETDGSMIQVFPTNENLFLPAGFSTNSTIKRYSDWSWGTGQEPTFSVNPVDGYATSYVMNNNGRTDSGDNANAYNIPYANHTHHESFSINTLATTGPVLVVPTPTALPDASVTLPEITSGMISAYNDLEDDLKDAQDNLDAATDPGPVASAKPAVTQSDIDAHMENAPAPTYTFKLNANDIDVPVEAFYNVAEDAGAGVTSSSEAGEFVKIDNSADIALGNGGDDTYIVGSDSGIYGGVALEYGNIGVRGGLEGSIDAVNFNSVTSVDALTFTRGKYRNEAEGNTLFIGDGNGQETVLFDNYNEYLDFRRVEYLTVEDGANNDEIFEIVTDKNLSDWDNEIYVADGGETKIELGGLDYVIGSSKADEFVVDLTDLIGNGKSGTVNLSGIDSSDTITVNDGGKLGAADEADLTTALSTAVTGVSGANGKATITFSYDSNKLTLDVDTAVDALNIDNREFDII
jgi:hypothetical protein